jgi:transcriptional regulator with PAS, ATPase and Fis domain
MQNFNTLKGNSSNFQSVLQHAKIIAKTDVTVLIKGETGTGKEILASAIQKESGRSEQPFVTINCAALPEGIVESELFGHRAGSFTGANENKLGILQTANHGTVFLDEINSLSLPVQAKLLRFLESGECFPVGGTKPDILDVRVITATNADLLEQITAGQFRQDLYFRLNVVPLEIPALTDRPGDIEQLTRYFIDFFAKQHSIAAPIISTATMHKLCGYSWPGNVRELRNLCERLTILLSGKTIDPENLPHEFHTRDQKTMFSLPEVGISLETLEADLIHQALQRTNGNRSQSARLLGITRDTLMYRIQKHGLVAH